MKVSRFISLPNRFTDNLSSGMNTTAGSFALLGSIVPRDATVAAKLRAAGAIILGKANLSEWANFRGRVPSGFSGRGGQATSPYLPNGDPSGSSSGSGISSAIGLAAGALGSETDGSILSPSSKNNLVGIKPTVGLTSRAGGMSTLILRYLVDMLEMLILSFSFQLSLSLLIKIQWGQ